MTEILLHTSYLVAIGFCFGTFGWMMLKAEKNQTAKAFMMCQILIIIWCLPQLFLAFADSREIKYALYAISYIGISFIGPCWLMFARFYCRKETAPWAWAVLLGIGSFDFAMFLSNGFHHMFYRIFELNQIIYGPAFYFHMVFTYTCVILGMVAVLGNFRKNPGQGVHTAVMLAAAAVPLGFNMLYLSQTIKSGFDLTPPMFALSSFMMLLAVFRYDFLDIDVVASRQIFSSIGEGIIVYNRRGKVTCCNDAACRYVQVKNGDDYNDVWERLCKDALLQEDSLLKAPRPMPPAGFVLELPDGRKLQVKKYLLFGRQGKDKAGVLIMTDVGEYYELLRQSRELADSRQRLAIEQERNRIAQEVHDTTGHALTMIQSLIKLIRIRYEAQQDQGRDADKEILEYIRQAQDLAVNGIRELRWSINHMRQGNGCQLVSQGVYQLAGSVKETDIEVEIQGEDGPEYSHLSNIVYQCLREAITNCLKYAKASHMDVIVKFEKASISVYMFDNGQGCSAIEEHNGLLGIRRRVMDAGGNVRYLSAEGEGFQIFLELPV